MAGVQVGVGYIDIRPDLSRFGRQLRRDVTADARIAGMQVGKEMGAGIARSAKTALAGIGAAAAGLGIKRLLGGAVKAASDLNEEASKSQAVFKGTADSIAAWAKGAAESLGLSERAALAAASSLGNMFVQLGFTTDQAAQMSKQIVELGVDFRSFTNANIEDVLAAQQAAFRGEYDSLQRFLPLMSAATIEQRAMELSGKRNAKQLTAQDKATATYRLMLEGAGDAAGDFARTHDSLANSLQRTQAATENANATIGQQMIPLMQQWNKILREEVIPAFAGLFSTQGDAASWASAVQNVVGDLVGWMVGTLQQFGRLVANLFEKVPGPWGEGIAADIRAAMDAADPFRQKMHATREELGRLSNAGTNAAAAAQLLAPATKKATAAVKQSIAPTDEAAKATKNLAAARRDLSGAERDAADARRGLTKAQSERDKALAEFQLSGSDDAADKLAEADENLADAKDAVADADDRVLDARDRVDDAESKMIAKTPAVVGAVDARTGAVKNLNDALGITKERLAAISAADTKNILALTGPAGASPLLGSGGLLGTPPVGTTFGPAPATATAPAGSTTTTTINATVNVTSPQNADPNQLAKDIAWNLRTGPAKATL